MHQDIPTMRVKKVWLVRPSRSAMYCLLRACVASILHQYYLAFGGNVISCCRPYVSFEAGVPDKGRLSRLSCSSLNKVTTSIMLALVRAHRDTVQEVLFDLSDSYRYRLPAKSVSTSILSRCGSTQEMF